MPIYEYQCQECGHELEALRRISDAPLVECPECGKPALRKLVSAPSFRLKGGGWYETDFKTGDKKNLAGEKEAAKSSDKEAKGGEKEGGKKADPKPSTPADSSKGGSGSGDGGKAA